VGDMEVLELEKPKEIQELQIRTHFGRKDRIVIPAAVREALGMVEDDVLELLMVDGELRVSTLRSRIRRVEDRARRTRCVLAACIGVR